MGFLDDLGKSLNKVGKKTTDMASVAKLKLDITKHKSSIDKKYEELGSRVYFLAKENLEMDESISTLINEIDELYEAIKLVEAEIEKFNVEKPEEKESAPAEASGFPCSNCGAQLAPNTKFCGSCGTKVEEPAPVEVKTCPNCNAEVGDAKFCNSCGTSIE
jgi:NADH pyrophosphatase NudC (nudix superfamily)